MHTATRGNKGQNQRSGRGVILGSEGGQMPVIRRLPKVGFNSRDPKIYQVVKLASLSRFKEGTVIDANFLKSHGLIKSPHRLFKILGGGELKKPLIIHADSFSKSAQEKIVKIGGKAEVLKR